MILDTANFSPISAQTGDDKLKFIMELSIETILAAIFVDPTFNVNVSSTRGSSTVPEFLDPSNLVKRLTLADILMNTSGK